MFSHHLLKLKIFTRQLTSLARKRTLTKFNGHCSSNTYDCVRGLERAWLVDLVFEWVDVEHITK